MKKYYQNKLIRDNVPQLIKERGGFFEIKKVSEKEYKKLIREKLVEEAQEVATSSKENIIKELSNLLEVIEAIVKVEGINLKEVVKMQKQIRKIAGTYSNRTYLLWSDKPQGFGDKKKNK